VCRLYVYDHTYRYTVLVFTACVVSVAVVFEVGSCFAICVGFLYHFCGFLCLRNLSASFFVEKRG